MSKPSNIGFLRMTLLCLMAAVSVAAYSQRRINPVNNPATATQPVNEFEGDTARMNAKLRASMVHYHDEHGNLVYVDTITGREWRDTMALTRKIPMMYPLLHSASVSVDLWNPLMRAFGQHYGLIGFAAQVSLHNRYMPVFEMGLGLAHNKPADMNFTYNSPLSCYFRFGADYNFLYNSTPDYQFYVGLRYGFSPFRYSIEDVSIVSSYWDETAHPQIPAQSSTVGWMEIVMGLRVQISGPVSAGWAFRYHSILHESNNKYGKPWYIPGYGARGGAISGSVYINYTLDINKIFKIKSKEPETVD